MVGANREVDIEAHGFEPGAEVIDLRFVCVFLHYYYHI
jgi:hypothetical protein